jgi:hypothetical protein
MYIIYFNVISFLFIIALVISCDRNRLYSCRGLFFMDKTMAIAKTWALAYNLRVFDKGQTTDSNLEGIFISCLNFSLSSQVIHCYKFSTVLRLLFR